MKSIKQQTDGGSESFWWKQPDSARRLRVRWRQNQFKSQRLQHHLVQTSSLHLAEDKEKSKVVRKINTCFSFSEKPGASLVSWTLWNESIDHQRLLFECSAAGQLEPRGRGVPVIITESCVTAVLLMCYRHDSKQTKGLCIEIFVDFSSTSLITSGM